MVSIILPCFRPNKNWQDIIVSGITELRKNTHQEIELILVDDGNTDKTLFSNLDALKKISSNFRFISYETNMGKGYAVRKGVAAATGDYIIYTDINLPYTTQSILQILQKLEEGYHIVIGIKDDNYYSHVPIARKLISRTLRQLIKLFLRLPTTDTQCGLKGFHKDVVPIFTSTTINRYLFDLEFIRESYKPEYKFKVLPLPVTLKENITFSKMNSTILVHESLNFIKLLFRK